MNKIAVTTSGADLSAPLDPRFGRAAGFILFDLETDTFAHVDNQVNLDAAQGAGIQAAETIVRSGATALITGHCGPKAFRVLQAAGIPVHPCPAMSVGEAIEQFRRNSLPVMAGADVEGHWA